MYEEAYGMIHTPFTRSIPPGEIYKNDFIDDAVQRLKYASVNKLFAIFVGEMGTGKTTIMRHMVSLLPSTDYVPIYISESDLTPRMFYNQILVHMGFHTMQYTNARLTVQREIGKVQKKFVVMIDEGETLSYSMLHEIRFILNYKMDSENPFALIISANNEFWSKIKHESFTSTLNRVDIECRIGPFTLEETREYIRRQVEYSGHEGKLFSDSATSRIYKASKGVAAMINKVCTQSLLLGAQLQIDTIDESVVDNVLRNEITTTV